jgi:CRP-like cAMP-binding protein
MSATGMAGLLQRQGFLSGVSDSIAATLGEFTTKRKTDIDELLFGQGGSADIFYLVEDGLVAIELYAHGRERVVVEHVADGDLVGWSWLIPPYHWQFDARAVEPTTLIEIDAAALRARFETDPRLGYEIMRRFIPVMARRLASARERLVECVSDPS